MLSVGEKNHSGTTRYYCPSCKKTFTALQKKRAKRKSFFFFFEKYVLFGISYAILSQWKGCSVRVLESKFHQFLQESPPLLKINQSPDRESYLLIDALWFGKRFCMMLYRQSKIKLVLKVSFLSREYGSLIAKDLSSLKEKGYSFAGVVSDGGTGIRKAVKEVFGHIPHQICLAHLHRQATNCLGVKPKDERIKQLKSLADHLWLIESKEALRWWKAQLQDWINTNSAFLREYRRDEKGKWWFVHKGVRKSVRILKTAPEDCFVFLNEPLMPKTTNEIEAQFGNLTMKYLIHRGLKRERIPAFLNWYFYFYNKKLLS